MKRVVLALLVGVLYAASSAVAVSPAASLPFGLAGGAVTYLLCRPALFDETLTLFSPRLERVGLAVSVVGGLVGLLAGAAGTAL